VCHGADAIGAILPDLRYSVVPQQKEAWDDVVLKGALAEQGMVSFSRYLTPSQSEAVRAYVLSETNRLITHSKDDAKP
jgi:mono/diheme cytochrome c family protein